MKRYLTRVAATLLAGSLLGACGSEGQPGAAPSTHTAPASRTLTVFAASSLKGTFEQLADDFARDHPGVRVQLNFAGSSDLAAQIREGAPADVFASADVATMEKLGEDALTPENFATNTLEIAVPVDNPAGIESVAQLADRGVDLVVCAPQVPCGRAAAQLEAHLVTAWKPISEEQSVADVLGKVRSGEADAGLVYVTDVEAARGDVLGIKIPAFVNVVTTYPIAAVRGGKQRRLAHEWIDLVTGAESRKVLAAAGFGAP